MTSFQTKNNILPTDAPTSFSSGLTRSAISVSQTHASYIAWQDEVLGLFGATVPTPQSHRFRFEIDTSSYSTGTNNGLMQKVTVYGNYTNGLMSPICTLTRAQNFSSPYAWLPWHVEMSVIYLKRTPVSYITALPGCLAYDSSSNQYFKCTGLSSSGLPTNSKWEALNPFHTSTTIPTNVPNGSVWVEV